MDHERVRIHGSNVSCGVGQLSDITDATDDEVLFAIGTNLYHPAHPGSPVAFFIYSGTQSNGIVDGRAKSFFEAIEKLKFGSILFSDSALNPKTGNIIYVITWKIDHEAFKKWWSEKRRQLLMRNI